MNTINTYSDGITVTIELNLPEIEALHKTLGIAINNLLSKVNNTPHGSRASSVANSDLALLTAIQSEVLRTLTDINTIHNGV